MSVLKLSNNVNLSVFSVKNVKRPASSGHEAGAKHSAAVQGFGIVIV